MWLVAVRGLQRRMRRTLLGVFSIGLVVMMFIVIQSVSDSFVRGFFSHVYNTDVDVWVSPATSFSGMGGSLIDRGVVDQIAAVQGVESVEPNVVASNRLTFEDIKTECTVVGYQPGGVYADVELAEGRMPSAHGDLSEVVIDESIRTRLSELMVGDTIAVSGRDLEVVGFSRNHKMIASAVLFVPIEQARGLLDIEDGQSSYALVTSSADGSPVDVRARLSGELGDNYRVLTRDENIAEWERQMSYIQKVLTAVSGVSFLIGALVMTIIVYISVVERTRDLGILKALGATDGGVRSLVVLEAVSIAVPGYVVGVALSSLVVVLIPRVIPIEPQLPPALYLAAAAVTLVVALIGSVVGVRGALEVDPIVALRTV